MERQFPFYVEEKNSHSRYITSSYEKIERFFRTMHQYDSMVVKTRGENSRIVHVFPAALFKYLLRDYTGKHPAIFTGEALDRMEEVKIQEAARPLPHQFIIEGVDRLGKSTLIQNLMDSLGYYLMVHYDKPKKLSAYASYPNPLRQYQEALYTQMFKLIEDQYNIVFDRGHLGEMVYAPIYRGYSGDYVLELESLFNTSSTRLILLETSDFSFIKDDGNSFDFNKKEEEQELFRLAFDKSAIQDKIRIDINNGQGGYKTPEEILSLALKNKCTFRF